MAEHRIGRQNKLLQHGSYPPCKRACGQYQQGKPDIHNGTGRHHNRKIGRQKIQRELMEIISRQRPRACLGADRHTDIIGQWPEYPMTDRKKAAHHRLEEDNPQYGQIGKLKSDISDEAGIVEQEKKSRCSDTVIHTVLLTENAGCHHEAYHNGCAQHRRREPCQQRIPPYRRQQDYKLRCPETPVTVHPPQQLGQEPKYQHHMHTRHAQHMDGTGIGKCLHQALAHFGTVPQDQRRSHGVGIVVGKITGKLGYHPPPKVQRISNNRISLFCSQLFQLTCLKVILMPQLLIRKVTPVIQFTGIMGWRHRFISCRNQQLIPIAQRFGRHTIVYPHRHHQPARSAAYAAVAIYPGYCQGKPDVVTPHHGFIIHHADQCLRRKVTEVGPVDHRMSVPGQ